jgi:TRAP-type C4-dicarboxylate transport system permease small subunit
MYNEKSIMKHFEEHFTGYLFLFIALFMFYQVLSRYFLHHSLSYSEEIVRYLFIWGTMLGISAAFRQRAHLSINFLPERITLKYQNKLEWIIKLFAVLFFIVLIYHGILSVILQWRTHQTSAALGWPIIWVTLSIPIGALLSLISLFSPSPNQ